MEVSGQCNASATLPPGKNSGSHAMGAVYAGLAERNRLYDLGLHEKMVLKCTLKKGIGWEIADGLLLTRRDASFRKNADNALNSRTDINL